ncbi:hypothetical protein A2872_02245 [Candidatus Gottesmanbacteria bacterium RIFCSPHIGHO2_01_FULL_42_12]|uniref:Uncharacterized protein n=1 Tax=Candidatus Gottesmanbacteria bacterium RIFCSPHIGHO2_01_FULL_42_12 TaxID=1798377 RepID=A0A1F5Z5P8_9BACT|nr:MAG: hypothetical protein A2872_02245 [Candidatus Gottesmanbacteria bacterium RIFCSPHIGHO2_01_FULL_42_12]
MEVSLPGLTFLADFFRLAQDLESLIAKLNCDAFISLQRPFVKLSKFLLVITSGFGTIDKLSRDSGYKAKSHRGLKIFLLYSPLAKFL